MIGATSLLNVTNSVVEAPFCCGDPTTCAKESEPTPNGNAMPRKSIDPPVRRRSRRNEALTCMTIRQNLSLLTSALQFHTTAYGAAWALNAYKLVCVRRYRF